MNQEALHSMMSHPTPNRSKHSHRRRNCCCLVDVIRHTCKVVRRPVNQWMIVLHCCFHAYIPSMPSHFKCWSIYHVWKLVKVVDSPMHTLELDRLFLRGFQLLIDNALIYTRTQSGPASWMPMPSTYNRQSRRELRVVAGLKKQLFVAVAHKEEGRRRVPTPHALLYAIMWPPFQATSYKDIVKITFEREGDDPYSWSTFITMIEKCGAVYHAG